jgi:hypothetical protein
MEGKRRDQFEQGSFEKYTYMIRGERRDCPLAKRRRPLGYRKEQAIGRRAHAEKRDILSAVALFRPTQSMVPCTSFAGYGHDPDNTRLVHDMIRR